MAGADILIEDTAPGSAAEKALAARNIHAEHPGLVILSISDFGRDTSYRGWHATTPVLHALTSELSRSGIPGREPVVPPAAQLPYHVAAAQAAVMTMSVYLDRLRTGEGDLIDFSVLDGAMQTLDPPYGTAGTASAGVALSAQTARLERRTPAVPDHRVQGRARADLSAGKTPVARHVRVDGPPGSVRRSVVRPAAGAVQLAGADGRDRAVLRRADPGRAGGRRPAPRGADRGGADPGRNAGHRTGREPRVLPRGRPVPGMSAPVPAGVLEIDGHRANPLNASEHPRGGHPRRIDVAPMLGGRRRRDEGLPLEGVRVLDLGVIVVGSDTGRLFGDLGADVVKIENSAFPDGLRGNLASMSQTYAAGHRNKRSIGIDLRTPRGRALAHRLVAQSDVVLTNFKPGVADTLGMDFQSLRGGESGHRGGGQFGVRAHRAVGEADGLRPAGAGGRGVHGPVGVPRRAGIVLRHGHRLPRSRGRPDRCAGRAGPAAAPGTHRCRRLGQRRAIGGDAQPPGGRDRGRGPGAARARTSIRPVHDAPWGLFPAAGEDRWLAVTVRDDADWHALCEVIDRPDLGADAQLATRTGRDVHRVRVDEAVRAWTSQRPATEAMDLLQAAGVPAGAALRAAEVADWDYYVQRRAFREELHPHADEPFTMENVQIHSDRIADPPLLQAPLLGEQTREIAAELLGMDDAAIDDLIAAGVLEVPQTVQAAGR